MPELPDLTLYQYHLEDRLLQRELLGVRLGNPFVLRSVSPSLSEVKGKRVIAIRLLGKRIVIVLEDSLALVVHLMIAGRFLWRKPASAIPKKVGLAAFDFKHGSLLLREVSSKKRASLHVVRGETELAHHDPGGIQVLDVDFQTFFEAITRRNHTLKRVLTSPRILSGIGNAYSDEILHAAKLSPMKLSQQISQKDAKRLFQATQSVLKRWVEKLRVQQGSKFPEKVTAFHEEMAVHGRFGKPCPECNTAIQRIVHGEHEVNYCPKCQTKGRVLADRALSKLLKQDWPRTVEAWEALHKS